VIICLVFMAIIAMYLDGKGRDFDKIKEDFLRNITITAENLNKSIAEVNAKEELINQKERVLMDYVSELNLSKERETSLGEHFIDLKNNNIYLEDKLNKTLQDRDRLKTVYDTTKKDFDVCKVDYQLEKDRSEERLNEITRIRNLKPSLQLNTGRLTEREDSIETDVKKIDSAADSIKSLADSIDNSTLRDGIKSKADEITSQVNAIDSLLEKIVQSINEIDYLIGRI